MTKKTDTWMPLLVDKYLGDTTHLNTEQHGAYLLLLMSMWKKDGRLPDDDGQLAQIARLTPAKWRAYRPVLVDGLLLRADGGWVTQKRLSAELDRSKAHTAGKAEAGKKGAAKRWEKDGTANGTKDGTAMADASQTHWQTGAHTPTRTPPPTPPSFNTEHATTAVGDLGKALVRAGIPPTSFSTSNPKLQALAEQGATPEEVEDAAREAIRQGVQHPVGWVIGRVQGMRADAARVALAPRGPAAGRRITAAEQRVLDAVPAIAASHLREPAPQPQPQEVIDVAARSVG